MAVSEIDTFYFKFKNLCVAGINATLTLHSEEGRAQVTLNADLGHLGPVVSPSQHPHGRNGPARVRRRERRAAARQSEEAVKATTEKVEKCTAATQTTEEVLDCEQQVVGDDTAAKVNDATATEEVTDEFCPNREYCDQSKVDESEDTIVYDIECWDPGNKWVKEDVFNHMGEALEQMFECFKIKSENQQYKLDVLDKVKDTFPLKLEMKKFPNDKAVIDNFRRQGYVPGGGCVKFFRKLF